MKPRCDISTTSKYRDQRINCIGILEAQAISHGSLAGKRHTGRRPLADLEIRRNWTTGQELGMHKTRDGQEKTA